MQKRLTWGVEDSVPNTRGAIIRWCGARHYHIKTLVLRICFASWLLMPIVGAAATKPDSLGADETARAAKLRSRIEAAPILSLKQTDLTIRTAEGQPLGMVSWVSYDAKTGITWILQRGDKADPIIAVDKSGNIVHSFGKGLFKIPHAIRAGPDGNIWTVDAGSSQIIKFSPDGKELLHFDVGNQPQSSESPFVGATDIAFVKGHLFISDGYANARILEFSADGKKIREWGTPGSGPGQFHLPHSIVADRNTLYVADRENGRIEEFDFHGKFLREIGNLGRIYAVRVGAHGTLWATMAPFNQPPGAAGWIVDLNSKTGRIIGYIAVTDTPTLHCMDLMGDGEPITDIGNRVIRFQKSEIGQQK